LQGSLPPSLERALTAGYQCMHPSRSYTPLTHTQAFRQSRNDIIEKLSLPSVEALTQTPGSSLVFAC